VAHRKIRLSQLDILIPEHDGSDDCRHLCRHIERVTRMRQQVHGASPGQQTRLADVPASEHAVIPEATEDIPRLEVMSGCQHVKHKEQGIGYRVQRNSFAVESGGQHPAVQRHR